MRKRDGFFYLPLFLFLNLRRLALREGAGFFILLF